MRRRWFPSPVLLDFLRNLFFKKNLNNVWSMGSWCYCFKFLDFWISKVKSYKQFKFLVFRLLKWVFRRFVFIWDIFTKVNISCVKFESYTHPSTHQFDTIVVQSCHKLSEAGLMFQFRDYQQITFVTLK